MQGTSLLPCPNSMAPSLNFSNPHHPSAAPVFRTPTASSFASLGASSRVLPVPLNRLRPCCHLPPPVRCTVTQKVLETSVSKSEFVEIGYVSNVHGLQGEISIKPNTDFPELRFSKPGRRWLRQQVSGRETIQEVELVEGRGHPGQKSWIIRFSGIDSVDLAKQLVGSTLLVTEEDRPTLDDGEFYTHDLVGMRVFLEETGELVGTIVNIFNSGASDLLQVQLDSSKLSPDANGRPKVGTGVSGAHVWVPFVEAIVPIVDMDRREMHITPPKGLLELNLRTDERSKKERRQLEWKQRKKFQQRFKAAKKKLCEMEQKHVLQGFKFGDKAQKSLLAHDIVNMDSKLLHLILENINTSSKRLDFLALISSNSAKLLKSSLKISELGTLCGLEKNLGSNVNFIQNGHNFVSDGKVAIVLVTDSAKLYVGRDPDLTSQSTEALHYPFIQELLEDGQDFMKMEDRVSVPLVLVCPAQETQYFEQLFSDHDQFAFDSEKVWFLEELKLPVVSTLKAQSRHKILMKSPWEILQSPVGSGGVISLLSSNRLVEKFVDMGVEYLEICSASQRYVRGQSVLLDLLRSQDADMGVRIFQNVADPEESFDVMFSMRYIKKLVNQMNKLRFHAVLKPSSYVEKVEETWVDVIPSSANSYEFRCSIYDCLNVFPSDKICVLEITE